MQALKDNSSSYYKLLEENRLLYNQVQDLKGNCKTDFSVISSVCICYDFNSCFLGVNTGNIRVYCRVKPFLKKHPDERSVVDHIGENGDIIIANPQKQGKDGRKIFSFNKIFGVSATQCMVTISNFGFLCWATEFRCYNLF